MKLIVLISTLFVCVSCDSRAINNLTDESNKEKEITKLEHSHIVRKKTNLNNSIIEEQKPSVKLWNYKTLGGYQIVIETIPIKQITAQLDSSYFDKSWDYNHHLSISKNHIILFDTILKKENLITIFNQELIDSSSFSQYGYETSDSNNITFYGYLSMLKSNTDIGFSHILNLKSKNFSLKTYSEE